MNNPFKGIVVPTVTPYRPDLSLDLDGVESVLAYFDQNPAVDGLFITGATGEYDQLSFDERCQIIDRALAMQLKKDWLPNTTSLDIEQSLRLTRYAISRGVSTVGVIFPRECQTFADVKRFLTQILDLGPTVFIYQTGNSPYPLSVSELGELIGLGRVAGIKDSCSGRDMVRHLRYITELGDRIAVIQGVEMLYLSSLVMGVSGVIGGGCNVYPELLQRIRQSFANNDLAAACRDQALVNDLVERLYEEGTGNEAMKYYLSLCGVCLGTASRKTRTPLSDGKKKRIQALYQQLHASN
ncbi:MAG: dihydrodipicolinate synthase family protein [Clostridiales bacterium]|nr:dihydrodipicolinate synthase family protein [Clostridiales bacterium]